MTLFKRRILCALMFLAGAAFCNIAFQYLGFVPGLVVTERSAVCGHARQGLPDWDAFLNYVSFVGLLLLSFVLIQQVVERAAEKPRNGYERRE